MYHTYTHSYINVIYTTNFLSTSNSLSCECNKISRREYLGKTGIWKSINVISWGRSSQTFAKRPITDKMSTHNARNLTAGTELTY